MKVLFLIKLLLILSCTLATTANASSNTLPLSDFSRAAEYTQVKISPTGKYLAVRSAKEEKQALLIMDAKTFKIQHMVHFKNDAQVGGYYWVNDERVVLEKQYLSGLLAAPMYGGELLAVNADGADPEYLVGARGATQSRAKFSKNEALFGTSYVLDPLIDNKDHMLIHTIPWGSRNTGVEKKPVVYRVNVYSGKRKEIVRSPIRGGNFLVDNAGNVRVTAGSDDFVGASIYLLDSKKQWQALNIKQDINITNAIGFSKDNQSIFVVADKKGEPGSVYSVRLSDSKLTLLQASTESSPTGYLLDPISKEPYGVEYQSDYPSYEFIDVTSPHTGLVKGLTNAFKGKHVNITSSTRAGDIKVLYTYSDKDPGMYYLLDASSKQPKLAPLMPAREWIDSSKMATTEAIKYSARDGLEINAYLTIPAGKTKKGLPLVVMPHGGPHGPRDYWGYNNDIQMLASRGIAVLQVNFRGSGGYGRNFEHAGHRKWGKEIQYDIIDGVQYLVKSGAVNKDNMCIMGASFGGYSALQSAIIEPDLFKCAIGVVGVYDLPGLFKQGNIANLNKGQKYLDKVLGDDKAQLKAFSPHYNIDKLKAPVLIIHGEEDNQAPIEQAHALVKALKKAKHPHQYMEIDDEGHGFYKEEHREDYYKTVLAFLQKHLTM